MKDLSNNVVVHKNNNGFQYLQFKKLLEFSDTLVHAYSLGIDKNYRTSLNIKNNSPELYSKAIDNYKELFSKYRNNVIVTPHIAGTSKQAIYRVNIEVANRIVEALNVR